MKAEKLKSKIRYAIATTIHSNPDNIGFQGYDNATEKCFELVQDYARIQIEKDREEASIKASEFGIGYNQIKIEQAVKDRPINLD